MAITTDYQLAAHARQIAEQLLRAEFLADDYPDLKVLRRDVEAIIADGLRSALQSQQMQILGEASVMTHAIKRAEEAEQQSQQLGHDLDDAMASVRDLTAALQSQQEELDMSEAAIIALRFLKEQAESRCRVLEGQIQQQEPCEWIADEDGIYDTGCGHKFFFDTDGPVENQAEFCCYCGKPLKAAVWNQIGGTK